MVKIGVLFCINFPPFSILNWSASVLVVIVTVSVFLMVIVFAKLLGVRVEACQPILSGLLSQVIGLFQLPFCTDLK